LRPSIIATGKNPCWKRTRPENRPNIPKITEKFPAPPKNPEDSFYSGEKESLLIQIIGNNKTDIIDFFGKRVNLFLLFGSQSGSAFTNVSVLVREGFRRMEVGGKKGGEGGGTLRCEDDRG
jgi:hypothetical protein